MKKMFILLFISIFMTPNSFSMVREEINLTSTQYNLGELNQETGLPAGAEISVKRTSDSPLISQLTFSYDWIKKVCLLKLQKTEWQPEKCSVVWRNGYYQRVCNPGYWKTIEYCGKEGEKLSQTQTTLRLDFSSLPVLKENEEESYYVDILQESVNSPDMAYAATIVESKYAKSIKIKKDLILFY